MKGSRIQRATGPTTRVVLLDRLRGDDQDAWEELVGLYTPLIHKYCRRYGLQEADSHDVAQAVFRNLFQVIGDFQYDCQRGRFRNWMGVVTRREIMRHLRKGAGPGRGSGNSEFEGLISQASREVDPAWQEEFYTYVLTEAWSRIQESFDETTRFAFQWTWMEQMNSCEAAARLDRSVGWVYKARWRVLQRLKQELDSFLLDEPTLHR